MAETFNQPPAAKIGAEFDRTDKDGKVVTQNAEGQGIDGVGLEDNPATTDPSAKLLESAQTNSKKVEETSVAENSAVSLTQIGLVGAAFVAGAAAQKLGLNRQALAMIGRGIETGKTAAVGAADLAPYARFVSRAPEVADAGLATRMSGWLKPGKDIIDGGGQVFMQADRTVVATNNLLNPNVFHAVNKFGDVGKFTTMEGTVHSLTSTIGKGPIRGFAITHETPALTQFASTTVRDGNRVARVMKDGEVFAIEGKGVFTNQELTAAFQQGQDATASLYKSVMKVDKFRV